MPWTLAEVQENTLSRIGPGVDLSPTFINMHPWQVNRKPSNGPFQLHHPLVFLMPGNKTKGWGWKWLPGTFLSFPTCAAQPCKCISCRRIITFHKDSVKTNKQPQKLENKEWNRHNNGWKHLNLPLSKNVEYEIQHWQVDYGHMQQSSCKIW